MIKTSSKKINDYWYQKVCLNSKGLPIYTYHYLRKGAPASKIIVWDTHLARQYCSYHSIDKDLRDTKIFIEEYDKLLSSTDMSTFKDNRSRIILKGWMKAIIITYGRCFAEADGRKIKLEKKVIKNISNLETHETIMEMRNQYIAHAGISVYEDYRMVLPMPPEKRVRKKEIVSTGPLSELMQAVIYENFTDAYESLFAEIHCHVKNKLEKINKLILDEINNANMDKLMALVKKSGSRREIKYSGIKTITR